MKPSTFFLGIAALALAWHVWLTKTRDRGQTVSEAEFERRRSASIPVGKLPPRPEQINWPTD